jgi:hypothetical protein
MIKKVPSIWKRQRICNKCRKAVSDLPKILEMKQLFLYQEEKIGKVERAVKRKIFNLTHSNGGNSLEMIAQLWRNFT